MACPEEAIELTEIYDFSDYTRDKLIIDKGDFWKYLIKLKKIIITLIQGLTQINTKKS